MTRRAAAPLALGLAAALSTGHALADNPAEVFELPAVTVIGTTLVIFALKAFDIIYVMTNGLYNTDVMARRMYAEMFTSQNYARSAAIAMLLLLAVIPVLAFNLRRFQFQEAIR